MTALAGLILASSPLIKSKHILLTDGNEQSAENIKDCIEANKDRLSAKSIASDVLKWNEPLKDEYKKSFEAIICADSLFFTEFHHDLLATIDAMLVENVSEKD